MDIVFSANNNQEVMVLPIVPNDIEIQEPQDNEEFKTINNGTLNLIGNMGLKSLPIESFFPTYEYPWIKKGSSSDGWEYVSFFKKWRNARVPIRIVITGKEGKEILNMPCTIDNFTYLEKRNGDIVYTLEVKEYRFVGV